MKLRKPIFLLRSLLLSGMAVLRRLRPERHRHARRRTGLYDQEQAAFDEKKEERIDGFRRMLCMTRLTLNRSTRSTTVSAKFSTNTGSTPPSATENAIWNSPAGSATGSAAPPPQSGSRDSIRPAAPASRPGSCSTRSAGAASRLSRTLLPDLHLLLRLLRVFSGSSRTNNRAVLPGFAPAASRNPGQYVRNQGSRPNNGC